MPSSPSILKEFLIAIGFKVDDQSYQNFQHRFQALNNSFVSLAKIAIPAMVGVSAAVLKASGQMESLYFATIKAGSSAQSLRSLQMAAEKVGIGADSITESIEAMATAVRSQPGLRLIFQGLGIAETADNTQNFINLITKLKSMSQQGAYGHAIATQFASQFGLDEQTLYLYENQLPDLVKAQKEAADKMAKSGINSDKQVTDFHAFMENVRQLQVSTDLISTQFADHLLPKANDIVAGMQKAVDLAVVWDKLTGGKSTTIGGFALAGGATAAGAAILKALGRLIFGGGAAAAGEETAAVGAAEGGASFAGPIGLGLAAITALSLKTKARAGNTPLTGDLQFGLIGPIATGITSIIQNLEGFSSRIYKDVAGNRTIGFGHRIQAGEDYSGGITREGALKLLAKDVAATSQAVQRLVHVHLGNNQLAALTDLAYNIGIGNFAKSTLLKDLRAGDFTDAANEILRWDKARKNGILGKNDALASRRLGDQALFNKPDVSISQQTTINVTGGNAKDTGQAVADQQDRVNADMQRNLQGAVQ